MNTSSKESSHQTANSDDVEVFTGVFTQQEAIPQAAIAKAVEVMQSGRLHRYNTVEGESSEASLLEEEFADYMQMQHCLAVASGGYAMQLALRACGLEAGQKVLTNAFTLSPVPGSIKASGGEPVLVETTTDLVIDLNDLELKITQSGARILVLSHMRGHIVDMELLEQLLLKFQVTLIEDCAHTMGASWNGKKSGSFGKVSCFSTQTYKHINSGEGGLLVSNDASLFARAILLSGSYMLYQRNGTCPDESHFESARYLMPNCSGRMDNLRAAILRPQLLKLDDNAERWRERYETLADVLLPCTAIYLPTRAAAEEHVPSSLQFLVPGISSAQATDFLQRLLQKNVELKWFGAREPTGFTSQHSSWRYMEAQSLPVTDGVLSELFDVRLPLTFSTGDCAVLGKIIVATLTTMMSV